MEKTQMKMFYNLSKKLYHVQYLKTIQNKHFWLKSFKLTIAQNNVQEKIIYYTQNFHVDTVLSRINYTNSSMNNLEDVVKSRPLSLVIILWCNAASSKTQLK
jgi:hypothetical protein